MTWVRLIELTVALILAPAALSKAMDVRGFALAVRRFDVVPASLSTAAAMGTIGVEVMLALLLFAGLTELPALAGAALLFAFFSGIGWLEVSRRQTDQPPPECGCLGGVLRLRIGRGSATLNLLAACICAGAAVAVAASSSDDSALSLSVLSLALLATPLAGTYWLAQYALSVVSTMEIKVSGTGEVG